MTVVSTSLTVKLRNRRVIRRCARSRLVRCDVLRGPSAWMTFAWILCLAIPRYALGGDCIDYREFVRWVGGVDTPGNAKGVVTNGNYDIADGAFGLYVVDISNANFPVIVGHADTPGAASRVPSGFWLQGCLLGNEADSVDERHPLGARLFADRKSQKIDACSDVAVTGNLPVPRHDVAPSRLMAFNQGGDPPSLHIHQGELHIPRFRQ